VAVQSFIVRHNKISDYDGRHMPTFRPINEAHRSCHNGECRQTDSVASESQTCTVVLTSFYKSDQLSLWRMGKSG